MSTMLHEPNVPMQILVFQTFKADVLLFQFLYQLRDLQHDLQLNMNLLAGSSCQQLITTVRWSEKVSFVHSNIIVLNLTQALSHVHV